jgi:hypothetical protein
MAKKKIFLFMAKNGEMAKFWRNGEKWRNGKKIDYWLKCHF